MRSNFNGLSALFRSIPGKAATFARQNRKFVALTLLCIFSFTVFATAFFNTNFVTIVDGDNTVVLRTTEDDTAALLAANGITVNEYDEVEETESGLSKTIEVIRAFPVSVTVDGQTINDMVTGGTVADLLKKHGIAVSESDILSHGEKLPLYSNLSMTIKRVVYETVTETAPIDFQTVKTPSADLLKGKTKEVTKGEQGVETSTLRNIYVDGILTDSILLSKETTKAPVNAEVLVGTKVEQAAVPAANRSTTTTDRSSLRASKVLTMRATAYTYGESGSWGNVTATGKKVKVGYVAVDPSVIPLGTRLYVEGYGYCVAEDTGGNIKGNRIDLFFGSKSECYNFGVRNVKVYVLS